MIGLSALGFALQGQPASQLGVATLMRVGIMHDQQQGRYRGRVSLDPRHVRLQMFMRDHGVGPKRRKARPGPNIRQNSPVAPILRHQRQAHMFRGPRDAGGITFGGQLFAIGDQEHLMRGRQLESQLQRVVGEMGGEQRKAQSRSP
jgi:hypothetical protein